MSNLLFCFFFFQAEDGIRDLVRSRGLGDVYKRQAQYRADPGMTARGHRDSGCAVAGRDGLRNLESGAVSYTHLTLPTSDLV